MLKKNGFITIYSLVIIVFTIYIVMDTFVNSQVYEVVGNDESNTNTTQKLEIGKVTKNSNLYIDDNIEIELKEYAVENTQVYVADVKIKNSELLKTAFANNSYGKNLTEKTSSIASSLNAILAINGDYYGVQESGYVLKNGVVYRDTSAGDKEDLVIYKDGSFEIINEKDVDIYTLLSKGTYNILSFGPCLVENGVVSVNEKYEVAKVMTSNPRTAIGLIDDLHYVFVVSDGRTSESEGLTLYELATFMQNRLGVQIAYNLDGGGSSSMYFNGELVNKPTTNGNKISERRVSDIVYIGY